MKQRSADDHLERQISYIQGRIEAQIEGFAHNLGIPAQLLATRISEVLRPSGPGVADKVPPLSRKAPQNRAPVGAVEVAGHARSGKASGGVKKKYKFSAASRKKMSEAAKRFWAEKKGKKAA